MSRHQHLADASSLKRPSELRKLTSDVHGFNEKTAILVPEVLGSMPFFWFCLILTLLSLPEVLTVFDTEVLKGAVGLAHFFPATLLKVSVVGLVAWVAQTFIQLLALPVLQVSGNATQAQLDTHVEAIIDALNVDTAGGIAQARDEIVAALRGAK